MRPLSDPAAARAHVQRKLDSHEMPPAVAMRMLGALAASCEPVDYGALLRAAMFPPPPIVVYHTAPVSRRSAIRREGLRVSQPGRGGSWAPNKPLCEMLQAAQPPGVYVTAHPDWRGLFAHWPRWDIWRVRRGRLTWRHDELNPGCWSFAELVPPWLVDHFAAVAGR